MNNYIARVNNNRIITTLEEIEKEADEVELFPPTTTH
jgi:molybdopterin converting factor small subunit